MTITPFSMQHVGNVTGSDLAQTWIHKNDILYMWHITAAEVSEYVYF
jgi:hypothetical protein